MLTREKGDFWSLVHRPYLRKDLNRNQVKQIIQLGMRESRTQNLKTIARHLGIATDEWRKFYLFIRRTIFEGEVFSNFDQ
jgi:hypothetical protein